MPKTEKKLVIVESPAKAKTLTKFLGSGFTVMACNGHIRDLPPKSLGVKIDKDFEPSYQTIKGKEKIVKDLKAAADKSGIIFLAPDPDREGEAIAWHLKALLGKNHKIKRIEFHEITKDAVTYAVKHPREIDMGRVNAQQARRILDRIVGYKISPLLWKKVRKGLSAGRVQSVAVRLICEREDLITAFKAEEYWDITAHLTNQEQQPVTAKLIAKNDKPLGIRPSEKGKVITTKEEADRILTDLNGASYQVSQVINKEQRRFPAPPFITSTLQQEASRKLGYSAKKTMMLAQKLYEGVDLADEGLVGLITYMRTDSVRVAAEAETAARKYIGKAFGQEFLPEKANKYKSKKQAQDAHEAIRPTSADRNPEKIKASLEDDAYKLYDLIWKRFIACQMMPAIFDQTSVDITAKEYKFRASGSVLKFEGFIRVYLEGSDEEEEAGSSLPALKENETLNLIELKPLQHFTEPPGRFTEASLVKELEKRGIGRPSTYAPIISTIQDRGYVIKDVKALKPTEIGGVTNGLLVKNFPQILDIDFTAHMEDDLDEIVEDKKDWVKVLKDFYVIFAAALEIAEVKMEKVKKEETTNEVCPECGKPILIREGRYGRFMACSGYPKCKYTKPLPEDAIKAESLKQPCDKCGGEMVMKQGRFGAFLACNNYPKCKNIKSISKKIGIKCPKCGGEVVEKKTRKHRIFYGCEKYPKCDFASWTRPVAPGEQHA